MGATRGGKADFYADPEVYDALHAPGTGDDVRALERIERAFAPRGTRRVWLEPACGSGRHLVRAGGRGAIVLGFDISPAMVAYARERLRRAGVEAPSRIFVADMRAFDRARRIPPVSFAFNLINTVRHLASDRALRDHLRCMARVLAPGGVYAIGIGLAAYGLEPPTEDVWNGSRGGLRVTQVVQYLPPAPDARGRAARSERVISHMTVRRAGQTRHVDSRYVLRTYSLAQWRAVLARAGWTVAGITDQDGRPAEAAEPGYAVWVLRPPAFSRSGSTR